MLVSDLCSFMRGNRPLKTSAFLTKPPYIFITETWCSQAVSDSELNIQNYQFYRCDRETKQECGCFIYDLDTLKTNKVEDSVLNSLPELVWISINNNSLLLGCIYGAPDSSDNVNDLIINAFIHAPALSYNAKVITGGFNYHGINWNIVTDGYDKFVMAQEMALNASFIH
ncbi:unnamed protein product [Schistosoma margrebowiei]|uniref:Uncharacterized protein n=1 Tax=Schistosoma margrebowiei TaxID=48269 RepID=A0A183LS51_9TREM|nr:unnamed protein product [Schistosoma margrebowiei]